MMKFVAKMAEYLAKSFKKKQVLNPFDRHIKEEPFKRYVYDKNELTAQSDIPYRTEHPHRKSLPEWTYVRKFEWQATIMAQLANCVRMAYPRRSDPLIDDYIIKAIANRSLLAF